MAQQLYPPDTRFYAGYVWVSEYQDCKVGLCLRADTPAAAAERMADRERRQWWRKGNVRTYYTLDRPDGVPVRHDVTL